MHDDLFPDERVREWLDASAARVSRRSYSPGAVSPEDHERLTSFCEGFRPFEGVRTLTLREAPQGIFTGIVFSYGKVTSPSALVFLGEERLPDIEARVGYTAEAVVLEATRLGLGTCWIGGGFHKREVARATGMARGERCYSISALGYLPASVAGETTTAISEARALRRDPLEEIAPGLDADLWPEWALAGLREARIGPSATNRQPWRFRLTEEGVLLYFEAPDTPIISKKLDCGIAMLHFELGARAAGSRGRWELGRGREVATWREGPDA